MPRKKYLLRRSGGISASLERESRNRIEARFIGSPAAAKASPITSAKRSAYSSLPIVIGGKVLVDMARVDKGSVALNKSEHVDTLVFKFADTSCMLFGSCD